MCYLTQVYSNPILTLLKVKRGKRNQKSQIFPNHMKYRKHLCTVGKAWPRSSKRSFNSDSIRAIHEHNSLQYCASSWCLYECFSNLRDWHTLIAANRQFTDLTFAPLLILITKQTRSSAIAEGLCDASCQLTSCQLPRNSAETTCTSPEQIKVMKLEAYSGAMCNKHVHSTMMRSSRFHCPISVINKPTTDELRISPVYRRLAVAKFSKSTMQKLLTWPWPRLL